MFLKVLNTGPQGTLFRTKRMSPLRTISASGGTCQNKESL